MLNHWIHKSRIGILELNSPSNRNALSMALLTKVHQTVESMERNPDIRVVVIQAAGTSTTDDCSSSSTKTPVFCSGHDLKEIHHDQQQASRDNLQQLFSLCSSVMMSIVTSNKPYIAKVDGMATAAGCQLVASCDLAFATRRSSFATPGVNIGLFCSTPAVALSHYHGTALAPKHAMEMLLTGNPISAERAEQMALVNKVLEDTDSLNAYVDDIAEQIASKSTTAIQMGKPTFRKQLPLSLKHAYTLASDTMVENALSDQGREGIDAFLNKRIPDWDINKTK